MSSWKDPQQYGLQLPIKSINLSSLCIFYLGLSDHLFLGQKPGYLPLKKALRTKWPNFECVSAKLAVSPEAHLWTTWPCHMADHFDAEKDTVYMLSNALNVTFDDNLMARTWAASKWHCSPLGSDSTGSIQLQNKPVVAGLFFDVRTVRTLKPWSIKILTPSKYLKTWRTKTYQNTFLYWEYALCFNRAAGNQNVTGQGQLKSASDGKAIHCADHRPWKGFDLNSGILLQRCREVACKDAILGIIKP